MNKIKNFVCNFILNIKIKLFNWQNVPQYIGEKIIKNRQEVFELQKGKFG